MTNTLPIEYWTNTGPLDERQVIATSVAAMDQRAAADALVNYHYNYWRLRRYIQQLEEQLAQ